MLGEGKDYDWEVSCDVKEVVLKWDTDDTLLMDVARCLHLAGGDIVHSLTTASAGTIIVELAMFINVTVIIPR